MVKMKMLAFFLLFFFSAVTKNLEAAPTVDASIDSMNAHAHYPLEGTVTITHNKEEKIDSSSFEMEGKPLDVSYSRDVLISAASDSLLAIYHFQLPAQEQGLYLLPSISVKIEGKRYQSIPSSYEVGLGAPAPPSTPAPTDSTAPLIFRLDAAVKGPATLYPGERTKLFYRISYNRNIDLTKSVLPMIHPAHFLKIGDVQIKDYQEKDVTVQDLTQEVEASEIGNFQFGPSVIEGYTYQMRGIKKEYDTTLLQAQAPVVTVEVKPFPKPDQPPSFTGALGVIQAEASLESSSQVFVGDTLQLLIKIEGIYNLTDLHLPALQCQPGISGFFQTSDLPPLAEVVGTTKHFHIELRPMSTLIKQIPPIELASYDPAAAKYVVRLLPAIPITVEAHPVERTPTSQAPVIASIDSDEKWPAPALSPMDVKLQPVQLETVKRSWISASRIFWLLPLGLLLLFLQMRFRNYLERRPRPKRLQSEVLLKEALKQDFSKGSQGLSLLEQAFWHRLWEKGKLEQGSFKIDELARTGQLDAVRSFILQLQALQYSSDKEYDSSQIKQTAKDLFWQV